MTTNWDIPTNFSAVPAVWAAAEAPEWEQAVLDTIPRKSGQTADTIQAEAVGNEVQVSGDKIAGLLEKGTGPHPIHTDKPHGLGPFEYNGRYGFHGQEVNHPGTGPDPYIENAIDAREETSAEALLDLMADEWSA